MRPYDEEGYLKDEVVKDIEKAKEDFKKGKHYTLEQVKKILKPS